MAARSFRERKAISPDCPDDLRTRVYGEVAEVCRQGMKVRVGATLDDHVREHAPHIFGMAEAEGFAVDLTSRLNTHKALCEGRLTIEIRRKPAN